MIINPRRLRSKNKKSHVTTSQSLTEYLPEESELLLEVVELLNQSNTATSFINALTDLNILNNSDESKAIISQSTDIHNSITSLIRAKLAHHECLEISLKKWLNESHNLLINKQLCDLINSPMITAQYLTSIYENGMLNNNDKRLLQPNVIAEMSLSFIKNQFAARTLEVAMLKSIASDNPKAVNKLLSSGLEMDRDQDFQLPWLHTCIHYDSTKVTKLLIKKGIDINQKDFNGVAPIHIAATKNHYKTLKLLLSQAKLNMNLKDDSGNTAIIIAANNNSWECLGLLLDSVQTDINLENLAGKSLLSCLINSEQEKIVSKTIEHSKLLIKSKHLINAIHRNNKFVVQQILQKDAELIKTCESEALAIAVSHGHLDVMNMLIENGANVNSQNSRGGTPLHIACEYSKPEIVKSLLTYPKVDLTLLDYRNQNVISIANAAADSALRQIENSNEVTAQKTQRFSDAQIVLALLNDHLKNMYI